jgi:integrase/recombinase XerD
VVSSEAPAQARSDAHLLELWLFGKSPHTRRAYQRVAGDFLATLGTAGLRGATLGDLQAWASSLPGKASSRAVTLAAVKSLLTFGHRIGYLPVNVGAALPLPKAKDDLAARILDREATPRDRALLRLLYAEGSPHWLRHAHATHAMDQGGAGVHLVKATLGRASVATTSTSLHARPDDSSALHLGL